MKHISESIIGRKGLNSYLIFVPVDNDNQYFMDEFGIDGDRKSENVISVRAKNHWNVWISTPPVAARNNINLTCRYSQIYTTNLPLEQVMNICADIKWDFRSNMNPGVPEEFEKITYPDYLNMIKRYK